MTNNEGKTKHITNNCIASMPRLKPKILNPICVADSGILESVLENAKPCIKPKPAAMYISF